MQTLYKRYRTKTTSSSSSKQHSQSTSILQDIPVGAAVGSVVPTPELYWLIVQLYLSDPTGEKKASLEV